VAAEADRKAARDHFEASAHCVASVAGRVDLGDHPLLGVDVHAVERRVVGNGRDLLVRQRKRIRQRHAADAGDVAHDGRVHLAKELA